MSTSGNNSKRQVWKCPKCDSVYESPIRVKEVKCQGRSHGAKLYKMVLIEGNPAPEKKAKKK